MKNIFDFSKEMGKIDEQLVQDAQQPWKKKESPFFICVEKKRRYLSLYCCWAVFI